ncbi:GTP-binding protein Era [Myxococcus xanthus DK 1622]|uniref:GTPase Era n=1 Tax=Myxococcus xanthus (strain DK1622) TaxID=246197 RepID=Q1D5X6_MYXXD|nr:MULTISPECIES: GTPase Era [Myxococcus]ABF92468.1 GTP-binding protein Era [Myxococcus xanthus DK 1622]NOJ53293.1 GTPase Era [Myxococcus xanthus]QPM83151.1 GTPase Era [Myxococcus xanthus]QVW65456.1 GTPase Era [Myxococcus xanthus DZ2]QZZ51454.1 GTPase Era [Myxococcus xanthus]
MAPPKTHRSGFAALIGRPNVGKSTLLNALTGEKIAIVSPKPQTTRNRILGVVTRPEGQVAFIDTPGIHQAKGELNRYMVEVALQAAEEVDLVLFLIEPPASEKPEVSPGNRAILDRLQKIGKPTFLVINKIDSVPKSQLLPLIDLYRQEFPFAEVVPISAREKDGVERLFHTVLGHLPEGENVFDEDMLTDQQERALVAEYIREQVLRHCRQEIPYSTAVVVDIFDESEREPRPGTPPNQLGGLIRIAASIFVERDSQKAIIIGKQGQMLKTIGTDARKSVQRLLGAHVYLDLRVRVEPRWSERPEGLKKLGYD